MGRGKSGRRGGTRKAEKKPPLVWYASKAPIPWRVIGGLLGALGAFMVVRLLTAPIPGEFMIAPRIGWEWNHARLIFGWIVTVIALGLSYGVYRGELISRLMASMLWFALGLLLLVTSSLTPDGQWPALLGTVVAALAAFGCTYLLTLWSPRP